jgi:GT2 family glycosyltransferase
LSAASTPFVTVIVPTRDRPAQLAACLSALGRLDYPPERRETIVVDDGGAGALDGPAGVVAIRADGAGPAAARNRAAERARGELLVFTDDDCRPDTGWLRALVGRWGSDPDLAVGGRTVNGLPDNAFAAASQTIVDLVYAHYNADPDAARFFSSNNLGVPAEAYRAVGGFDERFRTSEDREFCARWLASGRRLATAPEAVVAHVPDLTLGRFVGKHFSYGRGAYRYHAAGPTSTAASVRAELPFHRRLPRLLRPAFAGAGREGVPLAALLVLWQAANAVGFAWEASLTPRRRGSPRGSLRARAGRRA